MPAAPARYDSGVTTIPSVRPDHAAMPPAKTLRLRQRLGKYRIERRLGEGGFAVVYAATDTVEGVSVALKVPHASLLDDGVMDDFRREVRLAARLKHPNILPLKTADIVDGRFVIAFPLGERTLGERLQSRLSVETALDYTQQMLQATAHAHQHRVIHCDIKPDNFLLFADGTLMLSDFGIAKVAVRTVRASGAGTLGYCAPEQAMGKPSFRSDVFSLGLIMYRMFSGSLPEYPFDWPPPGYQRLRSRVHPDLVSLIRRALEVNPRRRYADAGAMLTAFNRVRPRAATVVKRKPPTRRSTTKRVRDWRTVQRRQFQRRFGKQLQTNCNCHRCDGPISELMRTCPWCGTDQGVYRGATRFPIHCPRCNRGMKLDWHYCPWCYGTGFEVTDTREYSDARYMARCDNPDCERKSLMPFMKYCPWCRRKVKRKWRIEGSKDKCSGCGWGVVREYWNHCPWCAKSLNGH
ncbi:MAG: serine/threonine-protein kinase [Pirellulales bacterium]|nr:protein kinase [Planctomycetales bacterium]